MLDVSSCRSIVMNMAACGRKTESLNGVDRVSNVVFNLVSNSEIALFKKPGILLVPSLNNQFHALFCLLQFQAY